MPRQLTPTTFEGAAGVLRGLAAGAEAVRIVGAGTKQAWGAAGRPPDAFLHTRALERVLEHNEGDLTAVLEAGVPLAQAQRRFAAAGQMLALDPPLGNDSQATIGGVLATGDSGPLRHRYGAPRDLVLGMTVALGDGAIARSGGKVIKNVAGYDLAKLFCGSFGTLGLILSVSVRLHPRPAQTATALGVAGRAQSLAHAARTLSGAPLELEALDIAWRGGRGGLLARCAGAKALARAQRTAKLMHEAGLEHVEVSEQDDPLWERQRAGQRSATRVLVRVAFRRSELAGVLAATDASGATLVGRASLASAYLELDPDALAHMLRALPSGAVAVVHDAPEEIRSGLDPWPAPPSPPALELMRRLKARFDPAGVCNPGVFVGGI